MHRFQPRDVTAVLALVSLFTPAWSQNQAPLVRSNSRLVLLDVVVTDRDGHAIRGLNQSDFVVLENGEPQKIASFEVASSDGTGVQATASRNLILLDELNISFSNLSYARDRVLMFLEQHPVEKQPTCLMPIGMRGLVMVQDYTQDSSLLKYKLAHLPAVNANPKADLPDNDWAQAHARTALESLAQIARAAVGSPYSINVVWLTSGFAGLVQTASDTDQVDASLRRVSNFLIRSRMRLYTIDPAGVMPFAGIAEGAETSRGSIKNAHNSSATQLMNSTHGEATTADRLLGHMTKSMGGLSFWGRNDVEEALTQATEDGTSSYLISYAPSNTTFDGTYRKIDVHIGVDGATARTRLGYFAIADDFEPSREITDARLDNAMSSVVPYGALAVSCPAAYDAGNNHLTGKIMVKPIQPMAGQTEQLIRVASFSRDHKLLNSWVWRINWKSPWTNREVSASFDKVLSPKSTMVRFVVSDATAERIGSCEYHIQ